MSDSPSRPIFNVYIDDSGTRHPDRQASSDPRWFALGGIIVGAEHEASTRAQHAAFCAKWSITYPLHSVRIRHKSSNFSWLQTSTKETSESFYSDLDNLMLSINVIGHACVINRQGYNNRYLAKYGRQRWSLCKSAFFVLCERVAKYAQLYDRRVRIFVEETDKSSDNMIRAYFDEIRTAGMPFAKDQSEKYGPLSATELRYRLLDLKFKKKSSPMIQIADLYLYPICRNGEGGTYRPYSSLRESRKIIDDVIPQDALLQLGVKYYCYD